MIVTAHAKLNLFLHIVGRRGDGYHLLESLVAFTAFGDTLEIVSDAKLSLQVKGEFAHELAGEDNLVLRAARLLQKHTACEKAAAITLHKHIPIGAGLGGGSADAAAALKALAALWEVPLNGNFETLGSDIPACVFGKPALVEGVGEKITPVAMTCPVWVVLVNPRKPLATKEVYRRYAQSRVASRQLPETKSDGFNSFALLIDHLTPMRNDLETPALTLMPEIADILSAIQQTEDCALARMSGSGATCFGLYEKESCARSAARIIQQAHPQWWCVVTQMVIS